MSADDGPAGGSPNLGDALVAALGFEPTDTQTRSADDQGGSENGSDGVNGTNGSSEGPRRTVKAPVAEGSPDAPVTVVSPDTTSSNGSASVADTAPSPVADVGLGLGAGGVGAGTANGSPPPPSGPPLTGPATGGASSAADTSEMAATGDGPPDARSSGVKPIAPIAEADAANAAATTAPVATAAAAGVTVTADAADLAEGARVGGVGLGVDPADDPTIDVPAGLDLGTDPTMDTPAGVGLETQPTVVAPANGGAPSAATAYAEEASALLAGNDAAVAAPTPAPPAVGDAVDPLNPTGPASSPPLAGVAPAGAGPVVVRRQSGGDGVAERMGDLAARVPQLLDGGLFKRTRRVRARKVRRVVRHVDPWSMLTFSVLFHLCLYAALLLASVLVWNAAVAAGTIENIESFIRELGDYKTYEINGDVVFRAAMVIAGILTLASSVLVVLLTVVFNLISDLVGGIRFTVIEEETVRVRRKRNQ